MFFLLFFGGLVCIVSAVLLAVLAFNVFAYENDALAIAAGAFAALLVIALFSALPRSKQTFFAWASAGIGVLAGLAFGFRANEFVQGVNVAVVLLAFGALLFVHAVERIEWNAAWLLRTAAFYPALVLQRLPGAVRLLKPSKLSGVSMVLRVLGITLVLVLFFAAILSSADPIFAEKIRVLREQVVPRTILSIIVACAVLLGLAASFGKTYTYKPLPLRFLSWVETAVPVGAVCVLFGVFLWVQATYLFGGHEAFKALDLTYAEYVRKGMIEVLVATACAGALSYVVSLKERELAGTRERGILYAVNAVLLLELFLMLGSALKRDWMYMDVYGLTRVRVVGEIFLAWLAVIVLLLAAFALWRRLQEKAVFAGAIAASFAVVLFLNASNMDARIASAAVPAGQRQDAFNVSLLSTDAVDQWGAMIGGLAREFEDVRGKQRLTQEETNRLANIVRAVDELAWERDVVLEVNEPKDWMSWTWSRENALRAMSGSVAFAETLPCLENELANYRLRHGLHLANEISLLENEYRRPFVNGAASYNLTYVDGPAPGVAVESCL